MHQRDLTRFVHPAQELTQSWKEGSRKLTGLTVPLVTRSVLRRRSAWRACSSSLSRRRRGNRHSPARRP